MTLKGRGFLGLGKDPVLTVPDGDVHGDTSGREAPHDHTLESLALEIAVDDGEPPVQRPPWFALAYIMKL